MLAFISCYIGFFLHTSHDGWLLQRLRQPRIPLGSSFDNILPSRIRSFQLLDYCVTIVPVCQNCRGSSALIFRGNQWIRSTPLDYKTTTTQPAEYCALFVCEKWEETIHPPLLHPERRISASKAASSWYVSLPAIRRRQRLPFLQQRSSELHCAVRGAKAVPWMSSLNMQYSFLYRSRRR